VEICASTVERLPARRSAVNRAVLLRLMWYSPFDCEVDDPVGETPAGILR